MNIQTEAEYPGWVIRCKVWFLTANFELRKLYSDVEIRTVNFILRKSLVTSQFIYASTDLTKEELSSSFQIEAF